VSHLPVVPLSPVQEVAALLDRGVYDNEVFAKEGWVTALKYEDEIIEDLKKRTGGKVSQVQAHHALHTPEMGWVLQGL